MIIKEVELDEKEKLSIYDSFIELFDPKIAINKSGHEINFSLNPNIEVWATLDLNIEYDEFDSNHQLKPISVYSKLTFDLYHKGNIVKGLERWNVEDKIQAYNWLQYF
jgi:hypothetical protein